MLVFRRLPGPAALMPVDGIKTVARTNRRERRGEPRGGAPRGPRPPRRPEAVESIRRAGDRPGEPPGIGPGASRPSAGARRGAAPPARRSVGSGTASSRPVTPTRRQVLANAAEPSACWKRDVLLTDIEEDHQTPHRGVRPRRAAQPRRVVLEPDDRVHPAGVGDQPGARGAAGRDGSGPLTTWRRGPRSDSSRSRPAMARFRIPLRCGLEDQPWVRHARRRRGRVRAPPLRLALGRRPNVDHRQDAGNVGERTPSIRDVDRHRQSELVRDRGCIEHDTGRRGRGWRRHDGRGA